MSAAFPHEVAKAAANAARPPRRTRVAWKRAGTDGLLASIWLLFALANLDQWRAGRPVGLGAMVVELMVVAAFIVRQEPWVTSRAPLAWVATGIGSFGALAARPAYAPLLGLEPLYVALQLVGAACGIFSLLYLGRSFGLIAANRGVRTTGPYGVVRHPLYAAYCLAYTGYTLENPSVQNTVLFLVVIAFQIVRIRAEEDCLRADPDYLRYSERVRFRLVPHVW